jgi:hypothetical protein
MPIKITIQEDPNVIHASFRGKVDELDLWYTLQSILGLQSSHGVSTVIVDVSEELSLPRTLSLYDFGIDLAREGRSLTIAVADKRKARNDLQFLVTVAQNRGARIQVFDTTSKALHWLNRSRIRTSA